MAPRWYAGKRHGRYSWEAFRHEYKGEPSEDQTPQYSLIIGPFQTRRAARWVENNPGCWFAGIKDVERAAREDSNRKGYNMQHGWSVTWRQGGVATEWKHEDGARIRKENRKKRGRYGLGAGVRYILTTEREAYAALTLEDAQARHRDHSQHKGGRVYYGPRWITDKEADKIRENIVKILGPVRENLAR